MSVARAVLLQRVFLKLRKTLLILYFLRPDLLHLTILNWRRSRTCGLNSVWVLLPCAPAALSPPAATPPRVELGIVMNPVVRVFYVAQCCLVRS